MVNISLIKKKENDFTQILILLTELPENNQKTQTTKTNTNETVKVEKLRKRRLIRRQVSPNSIDIENFDNGKSTTPLPRAEESIQILKANVENLIDRNVFDGPLDPQSNYTGFIEVIGKFSI